MNCFKNAQSGLLSLFSHNRCFGPVKITQTNLNTSSSLRNGCPRAFGSLCDASARHNREYRTSGRRSMSVNCDVDYEQGQYPEPKVREYFYYIDHQGMLFLDDARMKNFTSCFKDVKFLDFFFRRLRTNETSRYARFPFVSRCGRERNYIRCDDVPIVYTKLLSSAGETTIQYNHGSDRMVVPFQPHQVCMDDSTGRVYMRAPPLFKGAAPIALVHTKLAVEMANHFVFDDSSDCPTHLEWGGHTHPLDPQTLRDLAAMKHLRKHSIGIELPQD